MIIVPMKHDGNVLTLDSYFDCYVEHLLLIGRLSKAVASQLNVGAIHNGTLSMYRRREGCAVLTLADLHRMHMGWPIKPAVPLRVYLNGDSPFALKLVALCRPC